MFGRRQRAIVLKNVHRICELNAALSGVERGRRRSLFSHRPAGLPPGKEKLTRLSTPRPQNRNGRAGVRAAVGLSADCTALGLRSITRK